MKWIRASEIIPEIWYAHGNASKRLNLKVHGYPAIGRYVRENEREFFEIISFPAPAFTVFEKESFHLIEYLDESPSLPEGVEETINVFDLTPVKVKPKTYAKYWCLIKPHPIAYTRSIAQLEYGVGYDGKEGFLQEDDDFRVIGWFEFLPIAAANHPQPGIVEQLRKANPFNRPEYGTMYNDGYLNACDKLESILTPNPTT